MQFSQLLIPGSIPGHSDVFEFPHGILLYFFLKMTGPGLLGTKVKLLRIGELSVLGNLWQSVKSQSHLYESENTIPNE